MQLEVGQILEGRVTGITKFGVFVELAKGVTGMVHISEVSTKYVSEIRDVVKEGETVKVKVLSCTDNGKISLSIKQTVEQPERKERPRRNYQERPDSFQKPSQPQSFEDMMAKFKASSDEKMLDLKRKNGDARRANRRAPR